jgi:hypothetical protein
VRNAADVAKELPAEVLLRRTRPLIGSLRRKRVAGPGRPSKTRCPGCDVRKTAAQLRKHRLSCIRKRLQEVKGHKIRLIPKDPDPYPNFSIENVRENQAIFKKLSSSQLLTIELQKVAEISVADEQGLCYVRLQGSVRWNDDLKEWQFLPTRIGRPSHSGSTE